MIVLDPVLYLEENMGETVTLNNSFLLQEIVF